MNHNIFHLLWMLANHRVTATPVRVLRELRQRGKNRLPDSAQRELDQNNRAGFQTLKLARRWLAGERLTRHNGQWVINSFLPPFPGTAYNRLFTNMLSGRRLSPVSAFLAVTADCPNACWHCSIKGRRAGRLEREQWLHAIAGLHRLGTSIMGFTGGEPLLRPDLEDLIASASGGGAATILFTSGRGLDKARAQRLRKAGLWALCVSLDHPDPQEFDKLRGYVGANNAARAALQLAQRTGFYTMASAVATREFVEQRHYEALWKIARDLHLHEFRIIEPMPCGQLDGASGDTLLTPQHIATLRDFHVQTNRRGIGPKVCAFNQIESPEYFGCGAGTQHLYIDAAGEVCPCDFTPLSFGNAGRDDMETIWLRMNHAMGDAPRRCCFIQKHHDLVHTTAAGAIYPLPPETSERILSEAGTEPMPDFFTLSTHQRNGDAV